MTNIVFHILLDLLPLFTGLLVATAQVPPVNVREYLTQYGMLVLVFVLWSIASNVIEALLRQRQQVQLDQAPANAASKSSVTNTVTFVLKIIATFAVLLTVGLLILILRFHSAPLLYQLELVCLGFLSLKYRFSTAPNNKLTLAATATYFILASILSFKLSMPAFDWQVFVFCIAVGLALTDTQIALKKESVNTDKASSLGIIKILTPLAVFGIFTLSFTHDLPSTYLLTGISLIFPSRFQKEGLSAITFLGILAVLAYF